MFNIANLFIAPLAGSAVPGTLEWPAVGAVFAWLVILSLLGLSAGLLREFRQRTSVPSGEQDAGHAEPDLDVPHTQREAA